MSELVALVASPGGHSDQLFEIAERFAKPHERFWISARTPQTEALLADETVEWVPYVGSRQGRRAAASVRTAVRILRRRRPTQIVSTGAALAVPYLLTARVLGARVTYVESATRLAGPSVTGRIIERVPGAQLFHQARNWTKPRPRWRTFGSIFDAYTYESGPPRPIDRVLVTVGSERFPFPRALTIVRDGLPGVESTWQTGHTSVPEGLQGDVRAWWPGDELAAAARMADLVITHAGVGSILMVLRVGTCPIVIPRLAEHDEHIDNHQIQLAGVLEERGVVVVARPGDDLAELVAEASRRRIVRYG